MGRSITFMRGAAVSIGMRGTMARSDIQTFWKFLTDARYTGKPSSLTEDEVREMARKAELFEYEIDTVIRGLREFLKAR